MIFALIYLIFSAIVYVEMFRFLQRQSVRSRTKTSHPEMQQVKPGESLMSVRFNDPSDARTDLQCPDLGFARFLANNSASDRDSDGA